MLLLKSHRHKKYDINSAENKAYSNFDFTAGTKVIFYDDFSLGLNKWKVIEFDQADDIEPPGLKNILDKKTIGLKLPDVVFFIR